MSATHAEPSIPGLHEIEFDQVVVRRLSQSTAGCVTNQSAVCTHDQARIIVSLLSALHEAEESRCHLPGFAVDLLCGGEIVFSSAICWSCNNIRLSGHRALADWATFDGESSAARSLLAVCQEVCAEV